jgi:small subunit ribosomal protein S11
MLNKLYLTKLLFKQIQNINTIESAKKKPHIFNGIIYFKATKNNTFVSIATKKYATIFNYSLGQAAKSHTDTKIVINNYFSEYLALFLHKHYINVQLSFTGGNNRFRNFIIQNLLKYNIKILKIKDYTKLPHNGCKLKARQRGKYYYNTFNNVRRFQ